MGIIPSVEKIQDTIRLWAATKPFVKKAWLFGSVIKGKTHANSDVDIAIEIDAVFIRPETAFSFWTFEASGIEAELTSLIGVSVDAQHYLEGVNTNVSQYVADASLVLYEKATSHLDQG